MSRKHPHRAGNQPVTRRYVAGVVRRARDDILHAIIHSDRTIEVEIEETTIEPVSRKRLERAVNG